MSVFDQYLTLWVALRWRPTLLPSSWTVPSHRPIVAYTSRDAQAKRLASRGEVYDLAIAPRLPRFGANNTSIYSPDKNQRR